MTALPPLQSLRLPSGGDLAYRTAGDPARGPALILIHGFPSASHTFREVIGPLSEHAYVVAPDLPAYGASDPLPETSFPAMADAIQTLLDHLGVSDRVLYVHDYGAPVALNLAMRAPDRLAGLIIQNANAHDSGMGPAWADTRAFWADPTPDNAAKATAHLTLEGTRAQYVGDIPSDIAARIDPAVWREDWRVMSLPGRMEAQRALVADYGRYAARFGQISAWLARRQPPALLLWGRHDAFFDLAEVESWMRDLPRMEAHILDGGHFLLETQAPAATRLMIDFLDRLGSPRP